MTDEDIQRLDSLLKDTKYPVLDIDQIHGLLSAVACGPWLLAPSDWFPVIFRSEKMPQIGPKKVLKEIIGKLIDLYNDILESIQNDEFCPILNFEKNNDQDILTAKGWCSGFLLGVSFFEDLWLQEPDIEINRLTFPILYLANPKIATENLKKEQKIKLESFAQDLLVELGTIVPRIWKYWHEQGDQNVPVNYVTSKKGNDIPIYDDSIAVDRNDPCPCGSGKKFKKCCGKIIP